jgi:ribosomal protein L11 methyltransferase
MREVSLEIPTEALEDVLDRLLLIVPRGVREVERGAKVELRMRGDQVPTVAEIATAVGRWPHRIEERTVPDDWRERRLADYVPDVIAGRVVVRPDWARPPRDPGIIDIVLSESGAFGGGTHPTTHTCLEQLLALPPAGLFADLGCGTGVLAIAAARLGWQPVLAIDVQPDSVESARANAAANSVAVTATVLDLLVEPPPSADGIAANVPAWLHAQLAASLAEPLPAVLLISGFVDAEAAGVLEAYAARGLRPRRQLDAHGWVVAVLERDLRLLRR